ncbi:RutC family protein [Paramyrothecium foliicola]|nr:RutC family protein [Paramyrothecium foliicola]
MAQVTFTQTPGPLGDLFSSSGVSHAAKILLHGSLVITSGQPGFNLETGQLVTTSVRDEIEACFDYLEAALKTAGVQGGLGAVTKMTSFLLDIRLEGLMMEIWRKRMPSHKPTWVTIGVASLAVPGMHIKMQTEAIVFA